MKKSAWVFIVVVEVVRVILRMFPKILRPNINMGLLFISAGFKKLLIKDNKAPKFK